jgi:hypothetical protein
MVFILELLVMFLSTYLYPCLMYVPIHNQWTMAVVWRYDLNRVESPITHPFINNGN